MENLAAPSTPLAVIEQATTKHQRVHISTLENCISDFATIEFSSPALVIVGDVVLLHRDFKWFDAKGNGSVFKDLSTIK